MEFHPVSEIFPLMQGEQYDQLVQNIRDNGLLEPIWLHEDQIVDGRNRYRACLDAGVEGGREEPIAVYAVPDPSTISDLMAESMAESIAVDTHRSGISDNPIV